MLKKLSEYGLIAAGALLIAVTLNLVVIPLEMVSGGLGGLTVLIEYVWKIPNGPLYFALNVPIIFMLYRLYGWHGLAKTITGMTVYSLGMVITRPLGQYVPTHEPLLAALLSGVGLGVGVAIVILAGGSIGGNSALAKIIFYYTRLDMAKQMLWMDVSVLAAAALVFSVEQALYAVVLSVVTARVMQAITEGLNTSRAVWIISEKADELGGAILQAMNRGCTRILAQGEFTRRERPILLVVVAENELSGLKRLVHQTDPSAFMIVQDAREVRGLGFTLESELRPLPFWVKNLTY
jgi:uncharacterized membrane-anchored protein YitT (DUF2179 family)